MTKHHMSWQRKSSAAPGSNGSETAQDEESLGDPFLDASHWIVGHWPICFNSNHNLFMSDSEAAANTDEGMSLSLSFCIMSVNSILTGSILSCTACVRSGCSHQFFSVELCFAACSRSLSFRGHFLPHYSYIVTPDWWWPLFSQPGFVKNGV